MIKKVRSLQGYRIFRDFKWDGLPDFGRYNLIYGWNGTGKTTLSTLFRLLQDKTPPISGVIELDIEGRIVTGTDFTSSSMPSVRVFNRDFVDRNIFEQPYQELPPIFYLGEESAGKQQQIADLKKKHSELSAKFSATDKQHKVAIAELGTFCTTQARSIRNLLLGDSRYNNYEAPRFKALMQKISGAKGLPALLEQADREHLEQALSGKALPLLPAPSFGNVDLATLTSEVRAELRITVLSSTIQELVDAPEIANWVEQGLKLHPNDATHCHFCQQELHPYRLAELESHFNDHFKSHQARLVTLLDTVESLRKTSRAREIPERSALYPHLQAEFDQALKKLNDQSLFVETYLDGLKRALEAKRNEPFSALELDDYLTTLDFGSNSGFLKLLELFLNGMSALSVASAMEAVQKIASLVQAHNDYTDNFEKSANATRTQLERDEGAKAFPDWSQRKKLVDELAATLTEMQDQICHVAGQVSALEKDIKQHLKPAEELSGEMAAYLGRDELKFEAKETGYSIMRGNQPAMHLSEGERTAVAFMYFLKTLQDTDFDLKNGIVVIDDPVSSLDANSLYCAFGYMRERTKQAKQLFVLTHNFGFFRQVKNWFNYEGGLKHKPYHPEKSKDAHFYMLGMVFDNGQRSAALQTLDPLLHQYESEYHYLFRCINVGATSNSPKSLAEVYGLPNIARRLLEAFLSFRVPGRAGDLRQQLEAISGEPASKARIIRFLHTHSHMEQVGEPEHDLSVLSETPAILRDILALIKENDQEHYNAMMTICSE